MNHPFNESIYMNQSLSSPSSSTSQSSSSQLLNSYNGYSKFSSAEKTRKIKKQQKKDKKSILEGISSTLYQGEENIGGSEEDMVHKQSTINSIDNQYKLCKITQNEFKQCIIKDPTLQHKYLILPNIIIDFDQIKEGNYCQDQNTLRQFRSTACVNYLKNLDMVEMEIGINGEAIRQFSFICDMLDSLGNEKAHQLAQILRQYDSIISQCEQEKQKQSQNSPPSSSTSQQNQNQFSFDGRSDEGWTFEQSRQKAYKIIYNIASNNPKQYKYMYFRLLRGSKDTCELFSQINSREYLSFLLGTSNLQQIVQVILRHGMLIKKQSVDTFGCIHYSGEQYMYDTYNSQKESLSKNYELSVENTTINDCTYQMDLSFSKIQLSNYKDKFNDYLLIISPKKYDNNFMIGLLLKRLEEQKNAQQFLQSPNSSFMDISYQAQSEVFIEKFYSDKLKNQHA